ncbi:MAG: hypothetical protein ACRDUV_01810 [Pseudonocardiaceae bacterium]
MSRLRSDLLSEPLARPVPTRRTAGGQVPPSLTARTAVVLQRTVGNAAVARLLGSPHPRTGGIVPVQRCGAVPQNECPCHEADAKPPAVQRAIEVHDPGTTPAGAPAGTTNATIVDGYVKKLCTDFAVSGNKAVPAGGACPVPGVAAAPVSCACLCTMHSLRDPAGAPVVWKIVVDDRDWPHTDPATRTVTVHSGFSSVEFGAWNKSNRRSMYENWLVLAHEMCGHAALFAAGTHPTGPPPSHGGRASHNPTVLIENQIAAEHGIPPADQRGLFADPHHGESFARIVIAEFPSGSTSVAALLAAESAKLAIAKTFMSTAGVEADVIGHSDQPGTTARKSQISRARAASVKADLEGRRIATARFIAVRGVGSAECATAGPQPSCRKVELFMYVMRGASVTHR